MSNAIPLPATALCCHPAQAPTKVPLPPPRLRRPNREQVVLVPRRLEDLLPPAHLARVVWDLVGRWDLSRFLAPLRARGSRPGRPATDPHLLIALWLYAATQNVGCGRRLDALCRESDPYRWL